MFLKIWGIRTPDIAFINVLPEHIFDCINHGLQPYFFKKRCFGSLYLEQSKEFEDFLSMTKRSQLAKIHSIDLLKIALFDLWLANEDRVRNNPNLLLNFEEDGGYIYAIDHERIINSNIGLPLSQLTHEESILAHDLLNILFKGDKNITKKIEEICTNFNDFVVSCKQNLEEIIVLLR